MKKYAPNLRRIDLRSCLVAAALSLSLLVAPNALAIDADIKCRRDLGKGYRKLAVTAFKYQAKCHEDTMKGRDNPADCRDLESTDVAALKSVRKAEEKLAKLAAKSCAQSESPFASGLGYCPAPCGDRPNESFAGVVSCMSCLAKARATSAADAAYPSPQLNPEKDDLRCAASVGKATRILLDRRQKVQQRCRFLADRTSIEESCKEFNTFADPRDEVARAEVKLQDAALACAAESPARLGLCAADPAALGECLTTTMDEIGEDTFNDLYPEPFLSLQSPTQGAFFQGTTLEAHGRFGGATPQRYSVYVNGEVTQTTSTGDFAHSVQTSAEILQPVVVELRHTSSQNVLLRQRRTLHRTAGIPLGSTEAAGLSFRLSDRGLDRLEPSLASMVEIDLPSLLPPGTLVIDDFEYFCLIGCLTTDVTINPSNGSNAPPPAVAGFRLGADARAAGVGYVEAEIVLQSVSLSARVVELGCDINVTSDAAVLRGNFDLWWNANDRSRIDVTQLGGIDVSFAGFNADTDCGDGFGSGLLESLVGNFLGDVESLVRDGFTGFLDNPSPGDDDPPIASAIEIALAGFAIQGVLGDSLGVGISAPIADIPIDDDGITIRNDLTLTANVGGGSGQCTPPAGSAEPQGVVVATGDLPIFASGTPIAGRAYDVALSLSRTVLNQLLAEEARCGLLVSDIEALAGAPITTDLLALVFPEIGTIWPDTRPVRVEVRPGLAPFLTTQAGPAGEVAELRIGHLQLRFVVEDAGGDLPILNVLVDLRTGIEVGFDNILGLLEFVLGPLAANEINVLVLENPLELNEALVAVTLQQLLPAALPNISSTLGSFPIPEILGKTFYGLEASAIGGSLGVFADLLPAGTIVQRDFTGADFQTADFVLNGNAVWVEDPAPFFQPQSRRLRLTSNQTNQQGSAWYAGHRVDASQNWKAFYQFQLSYQGAAGADGLGFHMQSDGTAANPAENGVGLSGPRISVVVDTYNNGPQGTEESLYVLVNGAVLYFNDLLDFPSDPRPGSSPSVFRMELEYGAAAQELRIALFDEGSSSFLDERVSIDLRNLGPAHAGFSARTGGATQNHDVRSFLLAGTVPIEDLAPDSYRRARDFTGSDFETSSLALVGDAFWTEDGASIFSPYPRRLRLTSNGAGRNGAAWDAERRWDASASWSSISRFQITFGGPDGADGLGFHLQTNGTTINPNHHGFGLGGRRLSVVIDTWNNDDDGADESLQVWLSGNRIYSNNLQDLTSDPRPGSSPQVFRLEVRHVAPLNQLQLRLIDESGGGYLEDTIGLNLDGWGATWAGFSATTGTAAENHDIRTWEFTGVPMP
jgi:hypothetical protein